MSKLKLKILKSNPYGRWNGRYSWEMENKKVYICAYEMDGYSTKANAKRAALNVAKRFGITDIEIEEGDV